jgi:hypothetical protein
MTTYIKNKPITSKHRIVLREAYHIIELKKFYTNKYEWSDQIFNDMWWDIHGSAMNNFTLDEQTTLHKYVHRRLACNHRENLYYEYCVPICNTCNMAIETQDHVILCNTNESRKAYKINLIKDISKMMINNNTHDDLQRVICACLNAYIHGREIPTMNELADNPSDLLVQAYIDQEAIGWDNFLRGRMTKKWGEIYSRSNVTQNHETRKVKSKKWGKDLVVYCWKFFLSTWTERNQIEHGSASKEETNARV